MSGVVAVNEDSKTLSRQLDRCERDLDRREDALDRLDRAIAEMERQGETIPEDMLELQAAGREQIVQIREQVEGIREKLEELAWMEKVRRRLERRRKDRGADVVPAGNSTVRPAEIGPGRREAR